jgi:hypothetical protein
MKVLSGLRAGVRRSIPKQEHTVNRGSRIQRVLAGTAAAFAIYGGVAHADTFGYTGAEQTFVTPAFATSLTATLIGGPGGAVSLGGDPLNCFTEPAPGQGGEITATLPSSGGQTLYVDVGAAGSAGGGIDFGGGGASGGVPVFCNTGSGGGATDIRTSSNDLSSRVLVAGGGGGAGSSTGSTGGSAGLPDGASGQSGFNGDTGGGGGTQTTGGPAGTGFTGSPGPGTVGGGGGAGFDTYAGGGGGGYYGGGAGGYGTGGGGGSSYAEPSATGVSSGVDSVGTPEAVITYSVPITTDKSTLVFPATASQGTSAARTITFTNVSGDTETFTGFSFDYANGQDGDDYLISASTCGGTIPNADSCTVWVKFNPQETPASDQTVPSASALLISAVSGSGTVASGVVPVSGTATAQATGGTGATGSTGATGATGAAGATGATGAAGATGATGASGATGATGAAGAAGRDGFSPPTVHIVTPANGVTYTRGTEPRASYECTESAGAPGITGCRASTPYGQRVDMGRLGLHVFSVTATSADGLQFTETAIYDVVDPSNRFTVTHIAATRHGAVSFDLKLPGAGRILAKLTTWDDHVVDGIDVPSTGRFIFAKAGQTVGRATAMRLTLRPNKAGSQLVLEHRYRIPLRLFVTYTPVGGAARTVEVTGIPVPR